MECDEGEDEEHFEAEPLTWLGCVPALAVALLLIVAWLALVYLGAGGLLGPGG